MPQMAPLMRFTLFIVFSLILVLFSILNFWSFFQPMPNNSSLKPTSSSPLPWKR